MIKTMYRLTMVVTVASLFLFSGSLSASEKDDRIETSAKQSYVFRTYLRDDDITIKSEHGIVTLTGTVSEESRKLLAEETLARLVGVRSVENELKVKADPPTDEWLIARVKSALWFHRNLNAAETEISAKDGTITLSGNATSNAQKDLTTEYAKDVEGVKSVKNEMSVAMKPGEKTMGEKIEAMSESVDDASVTAMVKMTLMYHRSTSALNTTVETKDGVVMLGGKAGSAAAKELAGKFVSDVHGVKRVINNMTVK